MVAIGDWGSDNKKSSNKRTQMASQQRTGRGEAEGEGDGGSGERHGVGRKG